MVDIGDGVVKLLDGLYGPQIVDETSRLAEHYVRQKRAGTSYTNMPPDLDEVTHTVLMQVPRVDGPAKGFRNEVFQLLDVYDGDVIRGPVNYPHLNPK